MTTLVSLVGEQPIPVLLPARWLKPCRHVCVCTDRTRDIARRVLARDAIPGDSIMLPDAYDVGSIYRTMSSRLVGAGPLSFNVTGGTKPMMLAANALALTSDAPIYYLQTEGPRHRQQSVLREYRMTDGVPVSVSRTELPSLLTLDDYLRGHLPDYETGRQPGTEVLDAHADTGLQFELAVAGALRDAVDELMPSIRPQGVKDQLEIDLAIRCGNQVAILEVKRGGQGSYKHALDQLTTAGEPRYLGTYTNRFIVTGGAEDQRYAAVAAALRIPVISLRGYRGGQRLDTRSRQQLLARIGEYMPLRV